MTEIINKIEDNKSVLSKLLLVRELAELKIESMPDVHSIIKSIKHNDDELFEHIVSVATISCAIGISFDMRLDELVNLYIGGLLHDNGKEMLNQDILYKPASFSLDERQLVEGHCTLGYKRVSKFIKDDIILDIILKHHERLDESGYPNGIGEKELSLFVRIVAVADIFHALTSKRCYKVPVEITEALDTIDSMNGLDLTVVFMLRKLLHIEKRSEN